MGSHRIAERFPFAPTIGSFEGESGTKNAKVFLVSPEAAVAAALTGMITDPRELGCAYPMIEQPKQFFVDDSMFIQPSYSGEIFRAPEYRNTAQQFADTGRSSGQW